MGKAEKSDRALGQLINRESLRNKRFKTTVFKTFFSPNNDWRAVLCGNLRGNGSGDGELIRSSASGCLLGKGVYVCVCVCVWERQGSWWMDGWRGDSEQMEALMDCSYIKCERGAGPSVSMQERQRRRAPRHSPIPTLPLYWHDCLSAVAREKQSAECQLSKQQACSFTPPPSVRDTLLSFILLFPSDFLFSHCDIETHILMRPSRWFLYFLMGGGRVGVICKK